MPERRVVSNTSPLLYLHQVQQLDLLRRLYRRLIVPRAVELELLRGRELGIEVLKAKQKGLLADVGSIIRDLEGTSMRMSKKLKDTVLCEAGEAETPG